MTPWIRAAMAVDGGGRIHIVWPTLTDVNGTPTKTLFHAMTMDGQVSTPRARAGADTRSRRAYCVIRNAT
jgi:hypothetical protein